MEIARLTATTSGQPVPFLVVASRPLTIGRSRRCGLRLRDPKVSREHCSLTYFGGDLLVNDLGSAHGLLFHGERNESFRLRVGDGFHLGRTFVRFEGLDDVDEALLPQPAANDTSADEADEPEPAAALAPGPTPAEEAPALGFGNAVQPREAARHELAPGTTLAGFVVEATLGRSDRSTVYAAAHVQLQRRVALKVLRHPPGAVPEPTERAAFLADLRTAAAHVDPTLVAVFDVIDTPDECAATLELVDGETLASRLATAGRLPWQEVVTRLVDVLAALTVLHRAGRVHGGLKPTNVFALAKGGTRVADPRALPLPRAEEFDALPSPEQRRRLGVDARSDLYSVGALGWLLLTGEAPEAEPTAAQLQRLEPSVPNKLADRLVQLLAAEPNARPANATAARDALAALLPTSRPVAAERDPARSSVAPRAPARVPGAPAPMPGKRPASAGKRLAARFVSELIVVGMIFGIGLLVLVLLPKINPSWDLYKWVSSLFG
ncbi:MAG: serine/threonine-protein kinase [Planctomycetota bacterium]